MLKGTGLRARFTPRGSIVIMVAVLPDITLDMLRVEAASINGERPPDPQWLTYAQRVQRDVTTALEADPTVWRGAYQISLSFWLDARGQITRAQVLHPSGIAERDAAFSRAASNVLISSHPPKDLPQPLRVEFSVR